MEHRLPSGTVTLLFSDIEGSTQLLHALGRRYGAVLAEHRRLLRETWAEFDGREVDAEGDGFFVAFARADEAVAAGVAAQRRIGSHRWPCDIAVRVRIAVHTGTPNLQDGTYWGEDVHYAARLASAAHGGQILLSSSTRLLAGDVPVESLGEHAVKDFGSPREIFHVVVDGRGAAEFPPLRTGERARTNLPPRLADLQGRSADIAELARRAQAEPLLTVIGPGGVGKTRLLIEVGHRLTDSFDQVAFVAAERLTTVASTLSAVVRALGLVENRDVDDAVRIDDYLAARRAVLLIDNVEQVPDLGAPLARIAAAGAEVRVLVTSQAPLHVAVEHVFRLDPLPTPAGDAGGAAVLARNPAVAVLLNRAAAIGSSFQLDDDNAADVARLCAQLEGIPLALELAAARLELLTPAALTERLRRGVDGLGTGGRDLPARQRGLRAMLEWTCGLLEPDERALLAKVSVFTGGFTAQLAEAAFGDCLDQLAALIDVSLVRLTSAGRLRSRPPVRAFAQELLEREGDPRAAFAAVCDALAELGEPYAKLGMAGPAVGPERLATDAEAENTLGALHWALEHDTARHANLVTAMAWWMSRANCASAAGRHLEIALSRATDPVTRARCLHGLAWLGLATADPEAGLRAAEAWHELGDVTGEVAALSFAANMFAHRDEYERSLEVIDHAYEVLEAIDDANLRWFLDHMRAQAISGLGRTDEAEALLRPYLVQAPPGSWHLGLTATVLADVALAAGRNAEALPLYGTALQVFDRANESLSGPVIQSDSITAALAALGRLDEAAVSLALCDRGHDELGWPPRGNLADQLDSARERLDEDGRAEGRRIAEDLRTLDGLRWMGAIARGEVSGVASAPRTR